ncbi:hypothetical protein ABT364_23095 [Massilia sp. SR12]
MLFPIIVPRSYFTHGSWPGPHRLLRHPELAVTWVELSGTTTMTYLTFERCRELESAGIAVHAQAMANLRAASEQLYTHSKMDGDEVVFGVCMHEDGLGTSRLLLAQDIADEFPEGVLCGIPERSCGILAPAGIAAEQRADVEVMVQKCWDGGTTPMLPGLHAASLFELSEE